MDEGIGRSVQSLRGHGVERDTLIVFTSDNGGERFSRCCPTPDGGTTAHFFWRMHHRGQRVLRDGGWK